jgi:hypothetical protein
MGVYTYISVTFLSPEVSEGDEAEESDEVSESNKAYPGPILTRFV